MSAGRDEGTRARLDLGLGEGGGGWVAPTAEAFADVFPGVRVVGLAGRGGMGAVYRGEQIRLGRAVAVKILPQGTTADPLARERFEREARVLAALAHPGVLRVFDFGVLADGTHYLVSEWADGGDLEAALKAGPVAVEEALAWVSQIAAALDAAHARGVVHRDLKPANVLRRADGSLALADFGLARAEGAGFTTRLTLSGVMYGTIDYMAPEQADGRFAEVTAAADVYALGVLAYRLLAGRTPRGAFAPLSTVARVPKAVDAVIAAALAEEPARRPASAGQFARRLGEACGKGGARRRAGRALWWVAGVVLVAASGVWLWREQAESERAPEQVEVIPVTQVEEGVTQPVGEAVAGRVIWTLVGEEWRTGEEVAWLDVPAAVPEDFRYEVEVEFTRLAGRNSVGVVLPTASGTGVFELDAWEQGLGGWQEIDGRDLRGNGTAFAARLRNGERQLLRLVVDGARVTATWNGVERGAVDMSGRRYAIPPIWGAGEERMGRLGLCVWRSPTVFHRVELRGW